MMGAKPNDIFLDALNKINDEEPMMPMNPPPPPHPLRTGLQVRPEVEDPAATQAPKEKECMEPNTNNPQFIPSNGLEYYFDIYQKELHLTNTQMRDAMQGYADMFRRRAVAMKE